jgi:hypothetical protein
MTKKETFSILLVLSMFVFPITSIQVVSARTAFFEEVHGYFIFPEDNGSYTCFGQVYGRNPFYNNYVWMLQFYANGSQKSINFFGDGRNQEWLKDVIPLQAGKYAIITDQGVGQSTGDRSKAHLMVVHSNGNMLWDFVYDSDYSNFHQSTAVYEHTNGTIVFIGKTYSNTDPALFHFWKFTSDGELLYSLEDQIITTSSIPKLGGDSPLDARRISMYYNTTEDKYLIPYSLQYFDGKGQYLEQRVEPTVFNYVTYASVIKDSFYYESGNESYYLGIRGGLSSIGGRLVAFTFEGETLWSKAGGFFCNGLTNSTIICSGWYGTTNSQSVYDNITGEYNMYPTRTLPVLREYDIFSNQYTDFNYLVLTQYEHNGYYVSPLKFYDFCALPENQVGCIGTNRKPSTEAVPFSNLIITRFDENRELIWEREYAPMEFKEMLNEVGSDSGNRGLNISGFPEVYLIVIILICIPIVKRKIYKMHTSS